MIFRAGAALLCAVALVAAAAEEPPPREPGALEPWQEGMPLMSGDKWARLRIDVDSKGRPLKCRIAKTNVSRDSTLRFYFCRAMLLDWRTQPIVKDGVGVPGTVERTILLAGPARVKAEAKARKAYKARENAEPTSPD